ncbi:uncharacterized protein FTJAE_5040 [Fusarium tjaetaba]|uniref:Uncharacterized protein n=1 Tax=Fusarium tjaetaba TaxID=1567544 RepID=A0A8H5RTR8_9HYPO|nr:uncharacterized protein FTJAE_5040 [Fusarium tjaetaba]KAF5638969.1 hypothetical protein FTJAE_5040 [Fusarium tjaetaba]
MNTRPTRKRSLQQGTSPAIPQPAKRPRITGGMEPESIQEQILKLDPQALQRAYQVVQMSRDASKMRLGADAEWWKDGGKGPTEFRDIQLMKLGYKEEQEHFEKRERELETLRMAIKSRQGFQQGKDQSAELDKVEEKIRAKREMIRRKFDGLAAQARALDMPFLVNLTRLHCSGWVNLERATDKEGEDNGEDKEVEE